MTVRPVEFERLRFWVDSESCPGVVHLVDLDDDGKPGCSCHDFMCRGHVCKHIRAVLIFLKALNHEHNDNQPNPTLSTQLHH